MRLLVTGAAGFIGSHTTDLLLEEGHDVIGVDNLRTGRLANLGAAAASSRFQFEQADIAAPGLFERLTQALRPQAIIHLAALVSVQESLADPHLNFTLNVHATHLVAEAARLNGVSRIVFASSAAVYGRTTREPVRESSSTVPTNPYGWAKLASESLLQSANSFGVAATCLRYFNVYGPRQDPLSPYSGVLSRFRRQTIAGEPITIYGDGGQTRDFIHVSDVARANALAASQSEPPFSAINICTQRAVSLNQIVAILRPQFAKDLEVKRLPPRSGDVEHSCGNATFARQQLHFSAAISLEAGLRSYLPEPHESSTRRDAPPAAALS